MTDLVPIAIVSAMGTPLGRFQGDLANIATPQYRALAIKATPAYLARSRTPSRGSTSSTITR
jgi:acetyl-CoA acetyltransferase